MGKHKMVFLSYKMIIKTVKIIILGFLFPLLLSVNTHKFYVSVTEVDYIQEKKSVQIITRIFIDDLENALRHRYKEGLTFDPKNEPQEVDVYVQRYLKDKMSIIINGKPANVHFLGKEYDNDILFCYLEVTEVNAVNSFQISNKLLFESFDDQQNIIKLNINDKKKSFILIAQNDNAVLNF